MAQISWWRTNFGADEAAGVSEALAGERISQGPVTAALEEELAQALEVRHALVTTSGSAALALAFYAMGVGPGDEVIVPNRTWIATAHAVLLTGAKVVLADTLPGLPVLDAAEVRAKITPRTKAVVPVHLNGRSVDMDALFGLAREHGLKVVEDACQALFSRNRSGFLGTQSDAGCFSLGVTKLIATGQGGVVVTNDSETYARLKLLRNHGVVDNFTDAWGGFGFNFKFTDLLAAIGRVQLSRAAEKIGHVHEVYARYREGLNELPFLALVPVCVPDGELPLYVEVLCSERQQLIEHLSRSGIQARPLPPSLHTSPYLGNEGEFPNSLPFAENGMYLPCGPSQPLENVALVLEALRRFRP